MDAQAKLGVAITRLTDEKGIAPYLASVFGTLVRRESSQVPTLAVSKDGVLYWGRKWIDEQTPETVAWGLFHECMHVMLDHFGRAEAIGVTGETAGQANVAQDACINESLRDAAKALNRTLPTEWVYPETLQQPPKLIFEERYRLLQDQQQKQQPKQGQGGQGQGKPGEQGQGKPGQSGGGHGKPGVGNGQCGSCSGNPTPGEEPGGGEGGGRSQAEMDRMKRTVAEAVQATKGRGTVPGDLAGWADEYLAPAKVDWRTKLSSVVRDAIAYRPGAVDLHWGRPSRRQAGFGFGVGRPVLPAYRAPVPEIGVIVDTSGSVSDKGLSMAASEIEGVLRAVAAQVTVVAIDARVQGVARVKDIAAACATFKGRGGTDMTPGFEALEKARPRCEVVVVLTDGDLGNGFPTVEPTWCRTIWCVIGEGGGAAAPWGTRIEITDEGAREAA